MDFKLKDATLGIIQEFEMIKGKGGSRYGKRYVCFQYDGDSFPVTIVGDNAKRLSFLEDATKADVTLRLDSYSLPKGAGKQAVTLKLVEVKVTEWR